MTIAETIEIIAPSQQAREMCFDESITFEPVRGHIFTFEDGSRILSVGDIYIILEAKV